MIPYPTELPVDDIKAVITSIKNNSIIDDKTQFAKSVWTLEGYALGRAFGEAPVRFAQFGPPPTDQQIAACLEEIVAHHENPHLVQGLPNLPWKMIARWALEILITLL